MKARLAIGIIFPVLIVLALATALPMPSTVKGCFNPNDYPRCKATSTPTPGGGQQQPQNQVSGNTGGNGNNTVVATMIPTSVPEQVKNLLSVSLLVHRDKGLRSDDIVGSLPPGESADLVESDMIHTGLVKITLKNGTSGWIAGRNGNEPNVSIGES